MKYITVQFKIEHESFADFPRIHEETFSDTMMSGQYEYSPESLRAKVNYAMSQYGALHRNMQVYQISLSIRVTKVDSDKSYATEQLYAFVKVAKRLPSDPKERASIFYTPYMVATMPYKAKELTHYDGSKAQYYSARRIVEDLEEIYRSEFTPLSS